MDRDIEPPFDVILPMHMQFELEANCRKVDDCDDIDELRELLKVSIRCNFDLLQAARASIARSEELEEILDRASP